MAPPPPSSGHEMAYAVHTSTCTYLLDEDGICRWIVSQQGVVPEHVRQCIGAQFVACLDVAVAGGLVGDLRLGARALFVQQTDERMVLLRTGPIQHVDDRRESPQKRVAPARAPARHAPAQAVPLAPAAPPQSAYGKRLRPPSAPPKRGMTARAASRIVGPLTSPLPPQFGVVEYHGEEQTITISTRRRGAPSAPDSDAMTQRHRRRRES